MICFVLVSVGAGGGGRGGGGGWKEGHRQFLSMKAGMAVKDRLGGSVDTQGSNPGFSVRILPVT